MNPREQYTKLLGELRALADKAKAGTLTEEEGTAFDAKSAEARTLKAQIETLERREKDAAEFEGEHDRMTRGRGSAANAQAADRAGRNAGAEREADRQEARRAMRPAGQLLIESEGWREYRDGGFQSGRNSGRVNVGSFYHRGSADAPLDVSGLGPDELRTLIWGGALPTAPAFIAPNRLPGIYTPDLPEFNVRSVFLNLQTSSPVVQYFRELAFTNNAAFVAESETFSATTPSATNAKPESALTFEAATATAEVLAHWIPVTNQTLDDVPAMRGIVEGRLIDGLKLAEDDALVNGNGTAPNISGILDQAGTQALNGAYFAGAAVNDVGTDNENANRLLRARRLIRITGRARASFILLSPADNERFLTLTDADRQYMVGGGPFGNPSFQTMWGLRVVETEALAAGTAVVGDGRMAAVFDRMSASVTAGWINDMFVHNMIALLAEERLAFAVFRPAAFAVVTLAAWS